MMILTYKLPRVESLHYIQVIDVAIHPYYIELKIAGDSEGSYRLERDQVCEVRLYGEGSKNLLWNGDIDWEN